MKRGRPEGKPTAKPSLRIDAEIWEQFKKKYPGKVNKMFKEWVLKNI